MTKKEYRELLERYKLRTAEIGRSTIDNIVGETSQAQEIRIARLLKPENYGELFNYYFGKDTPIPLADSDCAWFHNAVYRDLYNEPFMTLFNLIFRGGAKSTHANLGYPLALKQCGLSKFFLTVGINEVRAIILLQDLQVQFEANHRIIRDFGEQKVYGGWAEGQFETKDRCNFMALGLDQPVRGLRAYGSRLDYVSIDDVEDRKRSLNTSLVNEYADKITGDIQGAFGKRSERTIINNNYFVENGIMGALLRKKGFNFRKVDTRRNQVLTQKYAKVYLVNLTTKYYTHVEANPQADDWEPSWKERTTREECIRKIEQYKNDRATLSNEFYNTPIKTGKRIKDAMIRMVKPKKLGQYLCIIGNWDFAYSTTAAYKALATLAVDETGITVIDIFCRQAATIDEALAYHYTRANALMRQNDAVLFFYDASVAQEAVYSQTIVMAARRYKSYVIPLPQKSITDKFTKIDTVLVGALTSGILSFSEDLEQNPDWADAKEQLLNFEKGSKFPVDFPDALTDAIIQAQNYVNLTGEEDAPPVFGKRKRGGY